MLRPPCRLWPSWHRSQRCYDHNEPLWTTTWEMVVGFSTKWWAVLPIKMAIEIVDLPIHSMVIFQFAMLVYQRVTTELDEELVDFVDEIVLEVSWNLHFCLCPNVPNVPCISYNPPRYLPLYHTPMNPNHQTRPQIPPHFWWIQSIYVNAQMKLPIFKSNCNHHVTTMLSSD